MVETNDLIHTADDDELEIREAIERFRIKADAQYAEKDYLLERDGIGFALVLLRVKVEHPCLRAARAESEELTPQQCRRHRHAEPSLSGLLLSSHRADVATRREAGG